MMGLYVSPESPVKNREPQFGAGRPVIPQMPRDKPTAGSRTMGEIVRLRAVR
jgi:hypothetical protein